MDFKDCIDFASENPVSYIATTEGDQPRVRAFMMWFADKSGFYFHTGASKNVYRQLKTNPRIEVCFITPKFEKMMRVTGCSGVPGQFQAEGQAAGGEALPQSFCGRT